MALLWVADGDTTAAPPIVVHWQFRQPVAGAPMNTNRSGVSPARDRAGVAHLLPDGARRGVRRVFRVCASTVGRAEGRAHSRCTRSRSHSNGRCSGLSLWRSDAAFTGYVARAWQSSGAPLGHSDGGDSRRGAAVGCPRSVRMLGSTGFASTQGMLPANGTEVALWIVLATSAGICEETVFRGYLQQQLSAWTGSVTIGIWGKVSSSAWSTRIRGRRRWLSLRCGGRAFRAVRMAAKGSPLQHARARGYRFAAGAVRGTDARGAIRPGLPVPQLSRR